MAFALVTAPASEPVTRAQAKAALRVDHTHEDDFVDGLIAAARELVEERTARQLMPATWRLHLDQFPAGADPMRIGKPPVTEIVEVTYYDTEGEEQTLDAADYVVDLVSAPPRIVPAPGSTWPSAESGRPNAVTVEFEAGYANAAAVPKRAAQAILLLVGHWYEHREAVLTGTISKEIELAVDSLIDSLKWTALADAVGDED